MLLWIVTAAAVLTTASRDTVVSLASRSFDMTGDGAIEVLEVVGVGESLDSLEITFSISSAGRVLYSERLRPMTRTVGLDGRRTVSSAEHQRRLKEFGATFFHPAKFRTPAEFVRMLEQNAPLHVARIPEVVSRSGGAQMSASMAAGVWEEIQSREIVVFEYPRGGDGLTAIAWSPAQGRFHHLWECC